jgi:hypothetical protein
MKPFLRTSHEYILWSFTLDMTQNVVLLLAARNKIRIHPGQGLDVADREANLFTNRCFPSYKFIVLFHNKLAVRQIIGKL